MTIAVNSMTQVSAATVTFTYGITGPVAEGKLAVNANDGLPIFDVSGNLLPTVSAGTFGILTAGWGGGFLTLNSRLNWLSGVGNPNYITMLDSTGPRFVLNGTANGTVTFNISGHTGARTYIFPDVNGTVTMLGNTATGTGNVVLAISPVFTGTPTAPTPAIGDNSTTIATTAFYSTNYATANPAQVAPTTGTTVTVAPVGDVTVESINPAGTLANLTLAINNGTYGGQIVYASFSQAITALAYGGTNITATGGQALPAAATLGQCLGFVWHVANVKWTRFL